MRLLAALVSAVAFIHAPARADEGAQTILTAG
jgi:hypothetical protein